MTDTDSPAPELPILAEPAETVPPIVDNPAALKKLITALAHGTGPVAVDTERAHGYRYHASAWLIQLRRTGAGTFLLDPMAFGNPANLSELNAALADCEWILHAASQDLPCLREVGLVPTSLFDTELAARLLNLPRVGLGPIIEQEFGVRLLKEHSAADWSTRPLPAEWLTYAALDVELLIPLREKMVQHLADAGRQDWAAQEFAAVLADSAIPREDRTDPWRRTSGMHSLRTPAQLALVRELWYIRDEIAQELDRGPGRILPDVAITSLAASVDAKTGRWPGRDDLHRIEGFRRRIARRYEHDWLEAIAATQALPKKDYPLRHLPVEGPPSQPRLWEARHPEEFNRWQALRPALTELAEGLPLPVENVLSPATLRQLAWEPPAEFTETAVAHHLSAHGARAWQVELLARPLCAALAKTSSAAE